MNKFEAWLETQRPKPVDKKERERMKSAIEFDLLQCEIRGICPTERMATFASLGYIYD